MEVLYIISAVCISVGAYDTIKQHHAIKVVFNPQIINIMKANEILQAAQMYNAILAALNECKKVNEASNYESDYLFVECNGGTHYTNELCDIMPNELYGGFYTCKTMEE